MTVDDIGSQLMLAQPVQGIVGEHVETVPQLLLGKVGLLTAVEADDACSV